MTPHATHDERQDPHCIRCREEFDAAYAEHRASYRAERELRQALALARADLDMAGVREWPELMHAIRRAFR
jgi:hypothetical protein